MPSLPRSARHRAPSRVGVSLRRTGHVALAGAASVAAVGLTAPAAQAHGHNVWDRVAECESSGNWHINTGNGFYGGLQFWHPTWTSFGGQEFAPYAHQATKLQQITVAQRVLQVQGPGAWPVCSVRAGLTLQNGSAPYPGDEPAPAPPGETGTWWVSSSVGANIRSGPGTGYAVIGGAAAGTKVTGTASNGWVKLADRAGWISLTTLTTSDPGTPAPQPPAPQPPPADGGTWWVSASVGANIRSGPGTHYAVVGGAAKDTKITGTASNGWVKIADGRFISLTTLTTSDPGGPAPAPPPSGSDTWRVSVGVGANIRSGPGTSYSVIGGAAHGTQVKGALASNGWVKLDGGSGTGWIYAGILTKIG